MEISQVKWVINPTHSYLGLVWTSGLWPEHFRLQHMSDLVAKWYSEKKGVDYDDIFFPVVRHISIRVLLTLVQFNMKLEQLDVLLSNLKDLKKPEKKTLSVVAESGLSFIGGK